MIKTATQDRLPGQQFFCFGVVGTIGFLADAGLLLALQSYTELGPYLGRVISFTVAATVTWALNRHFTFTSGLDTAWLRQWLRYLSVTLLGAGTNYAIYAALLQFGEATITRSLLAVAAGSLGGLAVNFTALKCFVFLPGRRPSAAR